MTEWINFIGLIRIHSQDKITWYPLFGTVPESGSTESTVHLSEVKQKFCWLSWIHFPTLALNYCNLERTKCWEHLRFIYLCFLRPRGVKKYKKKDNLYPHRPQCSFQRGNPVWRRVTKQPEESGYEIGGAVTQRLNRWPFWIWMTCSLNAVACILQGRDCQNCKYHAMELSSGDNFKPYVDKVRNLRSLTAE